MDLPTQSPYFPGTFKNEEFDKFMDSLMDAAMKVHEDPAPEAWTAIPIPPLPVLRMGTQELLRAAAAENTDYAPFIYDAVYYLPHIKTCEYYTKHFPKWEYYLMRMVWLGNDAPMRYGMELYIVKSLDHLEVLDEETGLFRAKGAKRATMFEKMRREFGYDLLINKLGLPYKQANGFVPTKEMLDSL